METRRSRLLSLAALLVLGACHGAAPRSPEPAASPFVGTWRLVSGTYTQPDGSAVSLDSTRIRVLKVISPTHFAYVTESGGRFLRAGAGTYRSDATTYTEHIDLTAVDAMRGQDYTFTYRLDGDTWYHNGTVDGTKLEEVYRRVR